MRKQLIIICALLLLVAANVMAFSASAIDLVSQKSYASVNKTGLALAQNPASAASGEGALTFLAGYANPYFVTASDALITLNAMYTFGERKGEVYGGFTLVSIAPVVTTTLRAGYTHLSFGRVQLGARVKAKFFSIGEVTTFDGTLDAITEQEFYVDAGIITHVSGAIRIGAYVENVSFLTDYYKIREPLTVVIGADFDVLTGSALGMFNIAFAGIYSRHLQANIDVALTLRKDFAFGFSVYTGFALMNGGAGKNLSLGVEYENGALSIGYAYLVPLTSMMLAGEHAISLGLSF